MLEAIAQCDTLIIAPSNPLVSIGPLLAVPGVRAAVEARRDSCIAISPIIAGAALKGPADRMLTELGHEASVAGVATLYRDLAHTLVVDEADRANVASVAAAGMSAFVCDTIMADARRGEALARNVLRAATGTASR